MRFIRGTGEADKLAVFGQQCGCLVLCCGQDVIAESHQQQRCSRFHGRRIDDSAAGRYGPLTVINSRIKSCVQNVGRQTIDNGMSAAQIDFVRTDAWFHSGDELFAIADGFADGSTGIRKIEAVSALGFR